MNKKLQIVSHVFLFIGILNILEIKGMLSKTGGISRKIQEYRQPLLKKSSHITKNTFSKVLEQDPLRLEKKEEPVVKKPIKLLPLQMREFERKRNLEEKSRQKLLEFSTEKQRKLFNPSVQTQEGIIEVSRKTIDSSPVLKSMLDDLLGNLPASNKDMPADIPPIPLSKATGFYSSAVIKDVQDLVDPIGYTKNIEDYSLEKLIERFNFLHFFHYPQEISDLFKKQIVITSEKATFDDIIKNKEKILTLDFNIPEFKKLKERVNTPAVQIISEEKEIINIPEPIAKMSEYISTAIAFKKQQKGDSLIELENFSTDILKTIFDLIDKREITSIKKGIENFSIEELIAIAVCLDFLQFSSDITSPFYSKIHNIIVFSQIIPMENIIGNELLQALSPSLVSKIFIEPTTRELKQQIIKKSIKDDARKIVLKTGSQTRIAAFSPNNRILACERGITRNDAVLVWKIDDKGIIDPSYSVLEGHQGSITAIAFSADSKWMLSGSNGDAKNLLLWKINDDGTINPIPQEIQGHNEGVLALAFHPSGKTMITSSQNSLLLWKINDGTIQNPIALNADVNGIDKILFSSNGEIGLTVKMNMEGGLSIWKLKKDGIPENNTPQKTTIAIVNAISFIPNSKKFIVVESGILIFLCLYDLSKFTDKNEYLLSHQTSNGLSHLLMSPDGEILLANTTQFGELALFSIIDGKDVELAKYINLARGRLPLSLLSMSDDFTKLVYYATNFQFIAITLFTPEEKLVIDKLKNLNAEQAVFIAKLLDMQRMNIKYDYSHLTIYDQLQLPTDLKELLKKLDILNLPMHETLMRHLDKPHLMEKMKQLDSFYRHESDAKHKTFLKAIQEIPGLSHVFIKYFKTEEQEKKEADEKIEKIKEQIRNDINREEDRIAREFHTEKSGIIEPLIRRLNKDHPDYKESGKYRLQFLEVVEEMGLSGLLEAPPLKKVLNWLGLGHLWEKYNLGPYGT